MPETIDGLFDTAIERYKAGEPATDLIPVFKDLCDRAPKSSPAWTCLAWLYLLDDKAALAHKAAQKAVKLNPQDAQARVNLAVAMLETGQKGLREHVSFAQQLIFVNPDWREEIEQSMADGLQRKPGWESLQKVKNWILETN